MTLKIEQDEVLRMAREAEFWKGTNGLWMCDTNDLERFAALVAEPWIETNKALAKEIIELKKQAEQEPVAWYSVEGGFNTCGEGKPLYAAPLAQQDTHATHVVRTKDLTDEEIDRALDAANVPELPAGYESIELEIARAVIAADREKNK